MSYDVEWNKKNNAYSFSEFKLVYIGSLGLETSYLKEVLNWVKKNKDTVSLDIYSFNIKDDALNCMSSTDIIFSIVLNS